MGSPPERFHHSPFEYNGYVFTNNESPVIKSGDAQASRRDALWPSPTASQSGDGNNAVTGHKKNTANGHVRRGCPLTSQTAFGGQLPYKGSLVRPAAIFGHSQSEYNGKFLRATNHEQRATIFSRVEGHSRRCRHSESVAAKRHLSPRRPATCQLRPAGPIGPNINGSLNIRGFGSKRLEND